MPFFAQLSAPQTWYHGVPMYHVIQPSGSRVEVPPLIEEDARELADWLNITADCAAEEDVESAM